MNQEVYEEINATKWYRSFEILPGIWTPGQVKSDPRAMIDQSGVPENLSGLRALDIGAMDGMHSFELERRGASVVAYDIQDPDSTAFNVAKRILDSSVQYVRGSIYELNEDVLGKFDVVLFFGVFYHLKDPLLAMTNIRSVIRETGAIFIEGEVLDYAYKKTEALAKWEGQLRELSDLPISLFVTGDYLDDPSNWFIPTKSCLESWLEASGYEEIRLKLKPSSRVVGNAKVNPRYDPWEFRISAANQEPKFLSGKFRAENPVQT